MLHMPRAYFFDAALFDQPLHSELPNRFEQVIAGGRALFFFHYNERLVDQSLEKVQDTFRLNSIARADRLRRIQCEATRENRKAVEDDPLWLGEQLVAPIYRRLQRLLAWHDGSASPGKQTKPIGQSTGYLLRGEYLDPSSG
jgi:hypothetical protein